MHSKEALQSGETPQRIFLLIAWRETDIFTEKEKAILELTEAVTLIHQSGVPEDLYQKAEIFFNQQEIGEIIMSVILINSWNRIAVSTHLPLN